MTTREKILSAIRKNSPAPRDAQRVTAETPLDPDRIEKFKEALVSIGGSVLEASSVHEASDLIDRLISTSGYTNVVGTRTEDMMHLGSDPHLLANIDLAILSGEFGVAENGAVWITERSMGDRSLPFICANLMVILEKGNIVGTMRDAYERIDGDTYEFATFIAGPSKTADIEQSLVLGAHGAKTMTVILIR